MSAVTQVLRWRPLLACDAVARNLARGVQTQHRVPIRPQPTFATVGPMTSMEWQKTPRMLVAAMDNQGGAVGRQLLADEAPYQVGDRLYVREAHRFVEWDFEAEEVTIQYRADGSKRTIECPAGEDWIAHHCLETARLLPSYAETIYDGTDDGGCQFDVEELPWRPSIHLPKWAWRTAPIVTAVRVERIRDISVDDCLAEGIEEKAIGVVADFRELWESLYPGSWEANELVWAWNLEHPRPIGGVE